MHMDDIKLFAKKEKKEKAVKSLILTKIIHSQDIGMEFVKEKCAMLIIKKNKKTNYERIEQRNQERISTL